MVEYENLVGVPFDPLADVPRQAVAVDEVGRVAERDERVVLHEAVGPR